MNETIKKFRAILVENLTRQLKTSTSFGVNTNVISVENMLVEDLMMVITGMDSDDDRYDEFHDTICGFVAEMDERFGL